MERPLCSLSLRRYAAHADSHVHAFHQLVLPCRGTLEMEITGRAGRVDAAWAAFVGSGERHAFSTRDAANCFLVVDLMLADSDEPGDSDVTEGLAERGFLVMSAHARQLVSYMQQRQTAGPLSKHQVLLWTRLLLEELSDAALNPTPHRPARALAQALRFIERNYGRPIAIDDVARAAGSSASTLYDLFRRDLSTTPRRYLAALRIDRALDLLASTELPIAEIAVRTGHADQSTLTRRLRAERGITPAAYRRSVRSGERTGHERTSTAVAPAQSGARSDKTDGLDLT